MSLRLVFTNRFMLFCLVFVMLSCASVAFVCDV